MQFNCQLEDLRTSRASEVGSSLKAGRREAQEKPLFQFKFNGRKRSVSQLIQSLFFKFSNNFLIFFQAPPPKKIQERNTGMIKEL